MISDSFPKKLTSRNVDDKIKTEPGKSKKRQKSKYNPSMVVPLLILCVLSKHYKKKKKKKKKEKGEIRNKFNAK